MNKIIFTLICLALWACEKPQQEEHTSEHKQEHHPDESHHESANEHMHQAPVSELIKRFESPERDSYQQPEKVLQYLGNIEGQTIMDIGAGSGYFSFKLLSKGAKVISADVNDEFLTFIKEKKEKEFENTPNLELRKLPLDNPSLKAQEVDKVLMVNTSHHIENRVAYFEKIKEGLKPTGQFIIIDFYKKELPVGPPPHHKISQDKLLEELKQAGFTKIETNTDLLEYQYIIKAQ